MADINAAFTDLQTDYIAKLNQLVSEANTALSLRLTQAQVDARVAAVGVLLTGLAANLNAAGYKITGSGNAVSPGDLCNLATVQALITGGGTPANIPITDLNKGTAAALQLIRVNAAGDAIEGYTLLSFDALSFIESPTSFGGF